MSAITAPAGVKLWVHEKRSASRRVPVLVVCKVDAGSRKPNEFLERALPDARPTSFPGPVTW